MGVKIEYDIRSITDNINKWLEDVYPDRHPDVVWSKLMEELDELKERPTDSWEWADVLILVFDLMCIYGIDPAKAIYWKMDRNRKRQWRFENGKLVHIQPDPKTSVSYRVGDKVADSQDHPTTNTG